MTEEREGDGLPARLQTALDLRHMSQSDLARKLDIRPQSVNKWLSGTTRPRDNRIEDMARALFVSYRWLAHGEGQMRHTEEIVREEEETYERMGFTAPKVVPNRVPIEQRMVSLLPEGASKQLSQGIDPWNTGRKIHIDYVSPNLVAEFCPLRPENPTREALQARLWRLAVIAKADESLGFKRRYVLMLLEDDPDVIEDDGFVRMDSRADKALTLVGPEAKVLGLETILFETPGKAAEFIEQIDFL